AHQKEQFDEAYEHWEAAALSQDATPELRSAARYWIGYEHNNLGDFDDARASFQLALDEIGRAEPVPVARAYDIRRIIMETAFFANEPEDVLREQLEQLLGEVRTERRSPEMTEVLSKVTATLGNVCHVAAARANEPAVAEGLYLRAIEL